MPLRCKAQGPLLCTPHCLLHRHDQFRLRREAMIRGCIPPLRLLGVPARRTNLTRMEALCAASMTTAQGGPTRRAGVAPTTGVVGMASLWMRRSGATCGYKNRWTVLIGQQTGGQFNESERGRSRPSSRCWLSWDSVATEVAGRSSTGSVLTASRVCSTRVGTGRTRDQVEIGSVRGSRAKTCVAADFPFRACAPRLVSPSG
jgi:hypothetical protein